MGLDMYLSATKYVSGYSFKGDKNMNEYKHLVTRYGVESFVDPDTPSGAVEFTVGYWRKANQIHKWFVDNVQNGEDDCKSYYVGREQLKELRDLCKKVLESTELVPGEIHNGTIYNAEHPLGEMQIEPGKVLKNPAVAQELLPPQEGFFFGGYDYDEWYWEWLEETVKIIDRVLRMDKNWEFEYRSSW